MRERLIERLKQLEQVCTAHSNEFHVNRGRLMEAQDWLNQLMLEENKKDVLIQEESA